MSCKIDHVCTGVLLTVASLFWRILIMLYNANTLSKSKLKQLLYNLHFGIETYKLTLTMLQNRFLLYCLRIFFKILKFYERYILNG